MKKYILFTIALLCCVAGWSKSSVQHNLLPLPQQAEIADNYVTVKSFALSTPAWADAWRSYLTDNGAAEQAKSNFKINITLVDSIVGSKHNAEAYTLNVTLKGINVTAASDRGIYWALQTLRQLAQPAKGAVRLPLCSITDWPAFPVRGFMMDVGRSYISMPELKREIELMSRFKLNTYHWHLTENQAWRLQSKLFPMLNDSTNMVRDKGRFYTVEDAKELQRFAREHNVTLIPEIDMPGHSAAFVRTFRHDMQSPEGMKILKLLIDEVCETFDSCEYLHIGTDEVRFTNPDFVPEMVGYIKAKGKKIISWHPGWSYKPGEVDMITMWSYRGKPLQGTPSVDMRFHYINHFDTYADINALYRSQAYGRTESDGQIAGVELGLWNDRYVADEDANVTQNNLWPTLMTLAERSWRGGGSEYFDKLGTRMSAPGTADHSDFADFERRLLAQKATTLRGLNIPFVKHSNIEWLVTEPFANGGDLTKQFPPETEGIRTEYTYADSTYHTLPAYGGGVYLRHVWGKMIPTLFDNPQPDHTAYAMTRVWSPKDQTVGLQFETQNYSRSESDLPPPAGKWDYRDSRLWLNGQEIQPPVWQGTHSVRDNEIPLTNENFSTRPPLQVQLHKGWNDVMIKLPVGQFNHPATRLVKWMWTFVLTTPDGTEAAPGLRYSASGK